MNRNQLPVLLVSVIDFFHIVIKMPFVSDFMTDREKIMSQDYYEILSDYRYPEGLEHSFEDSSGWTRILGLPISIKTN